MKTYIIDFVDKNDKTASLEWRGESYKAAVKEAKSLKKDYGKFSSIRWAK